jgi:heme exporter protein D
MYFDSLQGLLMMNGHGMYVWSAYLAAIAIIMTLLVVPMRRRARLLQQLAREANGSEDKTVGNARVEQ